MSRSEADKERWVEASKEVVETIRLRRREAWREFVHTQLQYTQDPKKTARVIRNINREQRMGSNFTLFSPTGRRLDTDSEKAKAFLNVFAKVSSKDHSLGISEDLTVLHITVYSFNLIFSLYRLLLVFIGLSCWFFLDSLYRRGR
jgi:hypothetical protein